MGKMGSRLCVCVCVEKVPQGIMREEGNAKKYQFRRNPPFEFERKFEKKIYYFQGNIFGIRVFFIRVL